MLLFAFESLLPNRGRIKCDEISVESDEDRGKGAVRDWFVTARKKRRWRQNDPTIT